ncbi:MAG: hypothetical protein AABZ67_07845 [Pseudomonadota bacterium]
MNADKTGKIRKQQFHIFFEIRIPYADVLEAFVFHRRSSAA